jgi:hypothetical protein
MYLRNIGSTAYINTIYIIRAGSNVNHREIKQSVINKNLMSSTYREVRRCVVILSTRSVAT